MPAHKGCRGYQILGAVEKMLGGDGARVFSIRKNGVY
jgi:hypothetical protein